ncbi:MAG: D-alanyl-D-alanine carboxypeptidase family protein [Mycobacteriales bacterium]
MRRDACLLAAAATVLLFAAPVAAVTPGRPPSTVVGGAQLANTGVVVNAAPGVPPLPTQLLADGWLVADLDTGQVLAAKDPHGHFLPASTLKVLTALTLLPRLDPATLVTATSAEASEIGSRVGLVPGQRYTVAQLFTAMLVVSGNDAADALAAANGGAAVTLAEMNARAHQLRADDTVAGTVSGLDAPGQRTSPYDLALIARAALALPAFDHYVTIRRSYMPTPSGGHFEIDSHNPLLGVYPGTIGVKNGYTTIDMATYIGAARRGGHTIIVTLMHAYPLFAPTAEALLNWGFAADGRVAPIGSLVAPLPTPAPPQAAAAGTGLRADSATTPTRSGGWPELGLWAAGLAAAVVLLRARVRLRRWWRRRRLALPRW